MSSLHRWGKLEQNWCSDLVLYINHCSSLNRACHSRKIHTYEDLQSPEDQIGFDRPVVGKDNLRRGKREHDHLAPQTHYVLRPGSQPGRPTRSGSAPAILQVRNVNQPSIHQHALKKCDYSMKRAMSLGFNNH